MIQIILKRKSGVSLSRQIYSFIKSGILSGTLAAGTKLPSTREMAGELHTARNVIIEGYEQLIAEGYIYSRNGSGTYVSEGVAWNTPKETAFLSNSRKKETETAARPVISVSFRTGIPDLSSIPVRKWAHLYQETVLDSRPEQLDYQNPMGEYSLRSALSGYLNRARGMKTRPENILITSGAAQSFYLLCSLVSDKEYALVENPLSYGLLHTLESRHISLKPIRLEKDGIVTEELPLQPPKLIFTTPSHQFPLGVVMPAAKRIRLIQYAVQNHSFIVEDDYDSEFRFEGSPLETMQSLAPDRVIYVGTFSKTLMPALRIGYMILPDELCTAMSEEKYITDIHSPVLEQMTLARFLESGAFELHIRQQQKLYHKKRNELTACLTQTFGSRVTISGAAAGLHFVAAFQNTVFDDTLLGKLKQAGMEISSVEQYLPDQTEKESWYEHALVFGYGNTPLKKIKYGVELLASVIKS